MPIGARNDGLRFGTALRGLRRKGQLILAFGVFWPALVRAARLLLTGRFQEFGRKLLNESVAARRLSLAHDRPGPRLFLAGQIQQPGGYDHLTLALLAGLTRRGVNVIRDYWGLFNDTLIPQEAQPGEARRQPGELRLIVIPPHRLERFRPDARTAVLTMWETDTLPPRAVRQINRCGLVIVPTEWGRECFRANGVRVPIAVVPLGYDPTVFFPRGPAPGCVFGTAGALDEGGLRKNVGLVVDLFRRAFPANPDVRLRVKITPSSPDVETYHDPRIEVTRALFSPQALADWYRSLTVFVNASAGEGFGLHLLEAMACGRPLISSRFGGVSAFFDSGVGYEIDYRLVPARNQIYQGLWSSPDDDALVACLREVHAHPEEAVRRGEAAARRASGFTWDETARQLKGELERFCFVPN